ncbi:membrane-associated proteins in eicosanoid and glutathione metabolism [Irpex rosettiformis]|uniref:Membrane-associated proteins in eicosanoid and glutathione metabolism n=1 Tax=Irpex rosettiformis TaxID=378272 RepID=A0ACB8U4X8_9APHY|nr:membrane-associated proteins in eicosanoid and glutathione metabolism [Irpex rosettiformis]
MSTLTIVVPKGYSYVIAAVVSTFWLTFYQTVNVGVRRKHAKIQYPQAYAEKAEAEASKEAKIFNCAQRAHHNTLEVLPQIYVGTLLVGLKYPIFAATICSFWTFSRVFYTLGYTSGDVNKRVNYISIPGNMAAFFGLVLGGSTVVAFKFLSADAWA